MSKAFTEEETNARTLEISESFPNHGVENHGAGETLNFYVPGLDSDGYPNYVLAFFGDAGFWMVQNAAGTFVEVSAYTAESDVKWVEEWTKGILRAGFGEFSPEPFSA